MRRWIWGIWALSLVVGCDDGPDVVPVDGAPPDAQPADAADLGADAQVQDATAPDLGEADQFVPLTGIPETLRVEVTLDGEPAPDVRVTQGGTGHDQHTNAAGVIEAFALDATVIGEVVLVASHPQARQRTEWIYDGYRGVATIPLERFGADDPSYRFADPGEPDRRMTTGQCGHCHLRINDAWAQSVHRTAASNPLVHDLYAGTASGFADEAACTTAGGRWAEGRLPGGGTGPRCYLGVGALPLRNADCADGPCPQPVDTAGCAACHAPAINGELVGRDLLEAEGHAFEYGVSCDVCHRVDRVDVDGAPGVAGRLVLTRPRETGSVTLGAGGKLPLTFGPSHDSPNPRMGGVQRDHFRDGSLCVGCHDYRHGPLVAGTALDATRWPDGTLPIQSTYSEWEAGPYRETVKCNGCHMPPDAGAANGGDLQAFPSAEVGVQGGWYRPAGSVRRHSWTGPRDPEGRLLKLAAGLQIASAVADGTLTAQITVKNVGAGHALPTGEPMRHLVLLVEATCDDAPLHATGGDVVPDFGGAAASQAGGQDWTVWPGAAVGDVIRVVRRTGQWLDYPAYGRFADFAPEAKGLAQEAWVGSATVTAVEGDRITTDAPLPEGDVAYRVSATAIPAWAGLPGFAWARVPVSADGRRMVHHLEAVDLASDNRLPPLAGSTSTHTFEAPCAAPVVHAQLYHRAHPWALSQARGWAARDTLMVEAVR
jgi:hypothetical protein